MRLFVNVYHPGLHNVAHLSEIAALAGKLPHDDIPTIEVEYPGTVKEAARELGHITVDQLLKRYPVQPMPSIHESMELADGHGNSVHAPAADVVTVGDLNSSARGTGARKSAGKPDWSQLPWWALTSIANVWVNARPPLVLAVAMCAMGDWQRGTNEALEEAGAVCLGLLAKLDGVLVPDKYPIRAYIPVVRVLEFGAKKYAKGNWAKGMPWSVCYTCTISHLTKAFEGEENDEESGLPHLAHALCNIIFLLGYRDLYPEGDDRLAEFRPQGVTAEGLIP